MGRKVLPILGCMIVLSLFPQTLPAKRIKTTECIVHLRGSGFVRGWLVPNKRGTLSVITLEGEQIPLEEDDEILSISALRKKFLKQKSDIRKEGDETKGYLHLLQWAKYRCLYEEAYKLAKKIIRRSGSKRSQEAIDTYKWAEEKVKKLKRTKPPNPAQFTWNNTDVQKIRFALLPTKGDVSKFKVTIQRKFLKEFFEMEKRLFKSQTDRENFLSLRPAEQAQFIKEHTGFKYQKYITIKNDPPQMIEFKKTVLPLVAKAYKDPRSKLSEFTLPLKGKSIPQIYGCFYLLDSTNALEEKLIDHANPENSRLLEYIFPNSRAPIQKKKEKVIQWIKSLPEKNIDEIIELLEEDNKDEEE